MVRNAARAFKAEGVKEEDKKPKLEDFLQNRDFTGAVTLLEFQKQVGEKKEDLLAWLGYSAFHLGEYQKALDVFRDLLKGENADPTYHLYVSCCLCYMGLYTEAEEEANRGPATHLQKRLLFHIAHRTANEAALRQYHQELTEDIEDKLSLASVHYLRGHFQDATEIYKQILLDHRDFLALQVYIALCYYKLDYYDVSLEILGPYLDKFDDSPVAINLKACNQFRLYDGNAAEGELRTLIETLASSSQNSEHDLIKHNLVVFRGGEDALQVLPPLVDVIPEARLNLVISHLRERELAEAYELMKDVEPTTPQEYILKAVVNACLGQETQNPEQLKLAQHFFQLVGASTSEMDTIPGRQCMASCFYLLGQFDDVMLYLNSVQQYCEGDANFNFNHGIALANTGQFGPAEEALLKVDDEYLREDYSFIGWLAKCYIANGKPRDAWNLYLRMESNHESFQLLQLIANDCYTRGYFYFAAKAFDVLERLDPSPEFWDGKRGACCGVFQMVVAGKAKLVHLDEIINMLKSNATTPQAEHIITVMTHWLEENA